MISFSFRYIALLLFVCPSPVFGLAQEGLAPFTAVNGDRAAEIDSLFADYDREDGPGFAVGVIQEGALVYAKGFGIANLDYDIPITSQTVFNLASISKQFTAACLALLIQEGKVSLDDEVRRHIAEFPENWGPVQVKHLVYMTSGIADYYRLERPGGKDWNRDYFTVDDAIAVALSQSELEYKPGTEWSYSNLNYMLMAEIVERVSGMPFSTYARIHLFEPLGMSNTLVNDDSYTVIPQRAIGYNPREEGGYYHINRHSPHYGGSGVFSTIEDLYRWDQSFYSHALGGEDLTALLLSTMRFEHDKTNDAFGLVWGDYNGFPMLWYSGGDAGFSSYMVRFPGQKMTVIVLANFVPADGYGLAQPKAIEMLDVLYR